MGLHLCYELSLAADVEENDVVRRLQSLREYALTLPFDEVSALVRLDEAALSEHRPLRGLAFESLEHVVQVHARFHRDDLYRESLGFSEEDEYEVIDEHTRRYRPIRAPAELPASVIGFAIDPGERCEPATFALTRLSGPSHTSKWWDHCCCKTQYASIISDDHLLRCHGSLVTLLDVARELGVEVEVRDETGYWASRDRQVLFEAAAKMNHIVAKFAGAFNDAFREATGDSSPVGGAISSIRTSSVSKRSQASGWSDGASSMASRREGMLVLTPADSGPLVADQRRITCARTTPSVRPGARPRALALRVRVRR